MRHIISGTGIRRTLGALCVAVLASAPAAFQAAAQPMGIDAAVRQGDVSRMLSQIHAQRAAVLELADRVGSTSQIIQAACEMEQQRFIVATDQGIFYKLQQQAPDKEFIIAPTAGNGASCRSCAHCPWMAMNDLETLATVFDRDDNEILVDPRIGEQALVPLRRMLDFAADLRLQVKGNA